MFISGISWKSKGEFAGTFTKPCPSDAYDNDGRLIFLLAFLLKFNGGIHNPFISGIVVSGGRNGCEIFWKHGRVFVVESGQPILVYLLSVPSTDSGKFSTEYG